VSDKPKDHDHFGAFESDVPQAEPGRSMTPLAEWDSRPKLATAKSIDPLAGVARLFPRDPRSPSEFERLRQERASRDTEPSDLLGDDDNTPAARPFEIRVEKRLDKLEAHAQKQGGQLRAVRRSARQAAQHAVDTYELVKAIDRRQRASDLERRWVPWAFRVVTLGLALWALLRTYR
jgi:hypothetical protein